MIKTKLLKRLSFLISLGLFVAPTINANAAEDKIEGTVIPISNEVNNSIIATLDSNMIIDDAMLLKQEIYINSIQYPSFGVEVFDSKTYLPLEVIVEKMGDILEGDISTEYYLRKENIMLIVEPREGSYRLNGQTFTIDMKVLNNHLYVPVDFFKNVLNYNIKEDGNKVYIGDIKDKVVLENTILNGKWNLENGKWYYLNGNTKVTGWVIYNNTWYYLNDEGIMQTGWIKLNEKKYFLDKTGAMQTGWITDKGKHYYLNHNGDMASNVVVDGFVLDGNGVDI